MADEVCVVDREIPNETELERELAVLHRWKQISGPQYVTLAREIAPHLPCLVILDMRTKKGKVRVTLAKATNLTRFAINNKAQRIG